MKTIMTRACLAIVAAGLRADDWSSPNEVADAAKKSKTSFEPLQSHMSGKRTTEKSDGSSPRSFLEDNR